MLTRTWVIAAQYREPADYGIPTLLTWYASQTEDGGLALAADADPFVRAKRPTKVRR